MNEVLQLESLCLDLNLQPSNIHIHAKRNASSDQVKSGIRCGFVQQGFEFAVDIQGENSSRSINLICGGHFEHLLHKLRPPSIPAKTSLQAVGIRVSLDRISKILRLPKLKEANASLNHPSICILDVFVYCPRSQYSKLEVLLELLRCAGIRATPFANALFVDRMNNAFDPNNLKALCQAAHVPYFVRIADKIKFEVLSAFFF